MSRLQATRSTRPLELASENQGRVVGKQVANGKATVRPPHARHALAPTNRVIGGITSKIGVKETTKPILKKPILSFRDENAGIKDIATTKTKCVAVVEEAAKTVEPMGYSATCLLPQIPKDVEDIDAGDGDNVLLASEYAPEIYQYLRFLEKNQVVSPNFMSNQKEMTPKMRAVLVDWMVNVHCQFKMLPETLFLAISIMDRFFQKESVCKDKIQLIGVTSFFIASKFEEVYPPDVSDFVTVCEKLYSKRDIIKMEMVMLRMLRFELGRPLPIHFLRRNSKAAHADGKMHTLGKYLMELTLIHHTCSSWSPSLLAAVCIYVTLKALESEDSDYDSTWTPTMVYYSGYTEEQILPHASQLCKIITRQDPRYPNIRKKYAASKFMKISESSALKCTWIKEMSAKVA